MNRRDLEKSWETTRGHLMKAHEALVATRVSPEARVYVEQYTDFLDHNELELAMESLAEAADQEPAPRAFWLALRDAALNMGLLDRAARFLQRAEQT